MGVLGFPLFLFYMLCEALGSIITAVAHDLLVMFSGTGYKDLVMALRSVVVAHSCVMLRISVCLISSVY